MNREQARGYKTQFQHTLPVNRETFGRQVRGLKTRAQSCEAEFGAGLPTAPLVRPIGLPVSRETCCRVKCAVCEPFSDGNP